MGDEEGAGGGEFCSRDCDVGIGERDTGEVGDAGVFDVEGEEGGDGVDYGVAEGLGEFGGAAAGS